MQNFFKNPWAAEDSNWFKKERQKFNENNENKLNNNLEFNSIDDFKKHLSGSRGTSFKGTNSDGGYLAIFSFNLAYVAGVDIFVKQKLTPVYEVSGVTSSAWGVTLSFSWEQDNYLDKTNGDNTIIDIYGKVNYNLFLKEIGTVYTEQYHFQVVVNNKTGKEVSMKLMK